MPAEYNTVVVRAKLASKMYESATKEIKICERLVFEQHLQQQGWAAVMANLEDLTNEFKQRSNDFLSEINEYVERRPTYKNYLESFQQDLCKLSTVPILNELIPMAQSDFHGFDEYFQDRGSFTGSTSGGSAGSGSVGGQSITSADIKEVISSSSQKQREATMTETEAENGTENVTENVNENGTENETENGTENVTETGANNVELELSDQQQNCCVTLLQWISRKENHKSLQDMSKDCATVLKNLDEGVIFHVKETISFTIRLAEQVSFCWFSPPFDPSVTISFQSFCPTGQHQGGAWTESTARTVGGTDSKGEENGSRATRALNGISTKSIACQQFG